MESLTYAQALTLRALTATPRTPAQVKHDLPGRVPVATVRTLLGQLRETGYAATAIHAKHPGVTAWVRTVPVDHFPSIVPVAAILAAGAEMGRQHGAGCAGCEHDCPWTRTPGPIGAPFCGICDDHWEAGE